MANIFFPGLSQHVGTYVYQRWYVTSCLVARQAVFLDLPLVELLFEILWYFRGARHWHCQCGAVTVHGSPSPSPVSFRLEWQATREVNPRPAVLWRWVRREAAASTAPWLAQFAAANMILQRLCALHRRGLDAVLAGEGPTTRPSRSRDGAVF
jgi:hypothetical protein